ncbi:SDR family NAD(P)-dependent oxidoreductase [Peterkaempfera bronchialis]|uniref:SDR family NAD(P)-dependent oxidoreductase n=2 Tax=Peterkaempfera bronchialis TaxID=2126346 RepID=A0A345T4Z9_9ACTN|nr:SDR family NAD(P)-dependent oxidoreductase [Peterkaempfera bronchialis]
MLKGRVVVVTGGGRGIGRAHCLELARHGATVVVNDLGVGLRGDDVGESPAEEVAAEIVKLGGEAVADMASVTDWDGVGAMVGRIVERYGRLDAVVNNAGILRDGMITRLREEDVDQVLAVHLKGTMALTHHACAHWREVARATGEQVAGRIVNTTSGAGLASNVGQAVYGAAKAGIANLTLVTAMEMARYGVTANAVSPVARTRMTTSVGMAEESRSGGWDPMDPENSSPVVAWLASAESGWLSGAVLRVDGNTVHRVQPWTVLDGHTAAGGERLSAEEIDSGLRRVFGVLPGGIASLSRR